MVWILGERFQSPISLFGFDVSDLKTTSVLILLKALNTDQMLLWSSNSLLKKAKGHMVFQAQKMFFSSEIFLSVGKSLLGQAAVETAFLAE